MTIQSFQPEDLNPYEITRSSAFETLVVPETNKSSTLEKTENILGETSRPSPNARQQTQRSQTRDRQADSQNNSNPPTKLTLSKETNVVEVRFKEERFSSVLDRCIDLALRDFHICANNHSLSDEERFNLVVNCFKGEALEFCLRRID